MLVDELSNVKDFTLMLITTPHWICMGFLPN